MKNNNDLNLKLRKTIQQWKNMIDYLKMTFDIVQFVEFVKKLIMRINVVKS